MENKKWSNFKNILCIRPDNIGDIIMTTPAIRALKEAVSGRKITLLTSSAGKSVCGFIPEIDDIIVFNTPWVKNDGLTSSAEVLELIEELKKRSYDAAVLFTVYSQNPLPAAMLCYLAGIPAVAGYCRENPYNLISDWVPETEPLYEIKHEVTRQMDLVRQLGANSENDNFSLTISNGALQSVSEKLQQAGVDSNKSWIVLHPGVSEARRQYPVELFSKAAAKLTNEFDCHILLTGVLSEKKLTSFIASKVRKNSVDLAGLLSMEELIALIKLSNLVIANNTGPVHIAAAMNTPVIVLYALTNPQHTPWKVEHRVLPFDVPEKNRSKNSIIKYAYEKAFYNPPKKMVTPDEIVEAAMQLQHYSTIKEKTETIRI